MQYKQQMIRELVERHNFDARSGKGGATRFLPNEQNGEQYVQTVLSQISGLPFVRRVEPAAYNSEIASAYPSSRVEFEDGTFHYVIYCTNRRDRTMREARGEIGSEMVAQMLAFVNPDLRLRETAKFGRSTDDIVFSIGRQVLSAEVKTYSKPNGIKLFDKMMFQDPKKGSRNFVDEYVATYTSGKYNDFRSYLDGCRQENPQYGFPGQPGVEVISGKVPRSASSDFKEREFVAKYMVKKYKNDYIIFALPSGVWCFSLNSRRNPLGAPLFSGTALKRCYITTYGRPGRTPQQRAGRIRVAATIDLNAEIGLRLGDSNEQENRSRVQEVV